MSASGSSRVVLMGVALVLVLAGCSAESGQLTDPTLAVGGTHVAFTAQEPGRPCFAEFKVLYDATGKIALTAPGSQRLIDGLRTKIGDAYFDMSKKPPKTDAAQQKMTDIDTKILTEFAGNTATKTQIRKEDVAMLRGTTDADQKPTSDSPLGGAQGCIAKVAASGT